MRWVDASLHEEKIIKQIDGNNQDSLHSTVEPLNEGNSHFVLYRASEVKSALTIQAFWTDQGKCPLLMTFILYPEYYRRVHCINTTPGIAYSIWHSAIQI